MLCQVAGVPTPPESADALANWDRKVRGGAPADLNRENTPRVTVGVQGRLDKAVRHAAYLRRLATAVVQSAGGILPVEVAARRTARAYPDVKPADVEDAVMGQTPVDVDDPEGAHGVRRFTTDAGVHLAVSSIRRLRQHLNGGDLPDVPEPVDDEAEDVPTVPVEVLRDPAPGYRRLTRRVVCEARRRVVDEAADVEDLAPEYGVEVEPLQDAVAGRAWQHIRSPGPVAEVPRIPA